MSTDRVTSLFWLAISAVVCVASWRLGLGRVSEPGSGFVPFGAAALLGILSIVVFARTWGGRKSDEGAAPLFRGTNWPRILLVFAALAAYTLLIPVGGYNVTTFLLMTFLFWIAGRQKMWKVALYALATTASSYYVFSRLMNLQFPAGPLGF
jgi:putative tricarboxylic transport membrane protein